MVNKKKKYRPIKSATVTLLESAGIRCKKVCCCSFFLHFTRAYCTDFLSLLDTALAEEVQNG